MLEDNQRHSDQPIPDESDGMSLTQYYLQRVQIARTIGPSELESVLDQINALPQEQIARLRSLLELRDKFIQSTGQAYREMDPQEDPQRFANRINTLTNR